jgi:hypothetical protein
MPLKSNNPPLPPLRDEYTPITDFRGLGETVGLIKRELKGIRGDAREARDGILEFREWKKALDLRLAGIEKLSGHDCYQTGCISELQEASKAVLVKTTEMSVQLVGIEGAMEEIKGSRRAVIGALVGIAMTVLGSLGGWVWTIAVMHADVTSIKSTQDNLQVDIGKARQLQVEQGERFTAMQETLRSELVIRREASFRAWWDGLSSPDKSRVRRALGDKGLP